MKFSLILATIGRELELAHCLASIAAQSHTNIQLIIVDQNRDDRVDQLIAGVDWPFELHHLRCAPGLSRARNVGLREVTGEVVAFPDDDCWYEPDLLAQVMQELTRRPACDGLSGRSIDEAGRPSDPCFPLKAGVLDAYSVWTSAISYAIFLRRAVCDAVGPFDESLGVGAQTPFGSAEETDYLLRAMASGAKLEYIPSLTVHHPNKNQAADAQARERTRRYAAGMGRVLTKHRYPLAYRAWVVARPLAGALVAAAGLQRELSQRRWAVASGRMQGLTARVEEGGAR